MIWWSELACAIIVLNVAFVASVITIYIVHDIWEKRGKSRS